MFALTNAVSALALVSDDGRELSRAVGWPGSGPGSPALEVREAMYEIQTRIARHPKAPADLRASITQTLQGAAKSDELAAPYVKGLLAGLRVK